MSGSAVFRRALIIFAVISSLCASAQERGFAAHRYEGSTAGSWLFMVDRPWYSSTRFFALGVTADGALNPLVPALATGRGAASPVISVALLGHVDVAGSFLDRVLLRASLPITLLERGTLESVSGAQPLRTVGIGDPRAGLLVRLFGQPERDAISMHLGGDVWFPVGAQATNEGDRAMRFLPRLVLAGAAGKARWTVDAGFLFRSYATIGPPALGMTASSEARLGAAFGFALLDDRLYLGPEVKFSTQVFGANAFALNGMSLEVLAGAQVLIAEHLQVGLAAGAGFFGAAGTPDARALVRLAWAPRREQASPLVIQAQADLVDAGSLPTGDADFDGVPNDPDRCPYEPENWNGVRDEDGCPEFMMASTSALAKVLVSESPLLSVADAGVREARLLKADAGVAKRIYSNDDEPTRRYDAGTPSTQPFDAGTRNAQTFDAGAAKRTYVDDDDDVVVDTSRRFDAGTTKRTQADDDATTTRRFDAGTAKRVSVDDDEVTATRAFDAGTTKRVYVDDDEVAPARRFDAGTRAFDAGTTKRTSADDEEVAPARRFDAGTRAFDAGTTKRTSADDEEVAPARRFDAGTRAFDAGTTKRVSADDDEVAPARRFDAGTATRDTQSFDAGLATRPPSAVEKPSRAVDAGVVVTTSNALDLIGAGVLVAANLDSDGDGLIDEADRCPVQPEDLDEFEDEDGCPELDNDHDGVPDVSDRCPLEAETPNGISDEDGCPDAAPDADNDWLADEADRCPFEPETYDGVRDDDGCPEYQGPTRAALAQLITPPVVTPERAPTQQEVEAALDYGRGDADKDGVIDDSDRCPVTPEDADGFEDEDGCPEDDNDDDGLVDATDKCPLEAETFNGWQDDDGCPDEHQDLDGDGLLYAEDRCPYEPGDKTDGCPHVELPKLALAGFPGAPAVAPTAAPVATEPVVEPAAPAADFDRDSAEDEADRCPVSGEDLDGFEDEDGCPEPDNDADGIVDSKDKCPFEAETINGVKDDDGCPDKGASKVAIEGEHIVIKGVILFTTGSAKLTASSMPLLKQVAATLKAASTLSVEVQGHTDDVGNAAKNIRLSKQRADAIRAVLIKGGVAENRLIANGYGPTRPVASNKTAKGREKNRRVEFLILGESK